MTDFTIFIVDDDEVMCNLLKKHMDAWEYESKIYTSATHFLNDITENDTGCILLDLQMPEIDGLSLQKELYIRNILIPVIFITGQGDIPSSVQAMQQGAFNFLQKPFIKSQLFEEVDRALLYEHERVLENEKQRKAQELFDTLSKREKEVFFLVVKGASSNLIGEELFISLNTVKKHRKNIIEKLGFSTVAEMAIFHSTYYLR